MALLSPEQFVRTSSTFLNTPEDPQVERAKTLPHDKVLDRTPRSQMSSGQPVNALTGPANGVPLLKLHHFYNCDSAGGEIFVDVAVLFMHGGDEDQSPCSIFLAKDTELSSSSRSPNSAVGQADTLETGSGSRLKEQKKGLDLQVKFSQRLEAQAKKNPADAQKQRDVLFDYSAKLLQSNVKYIGKTETSSTQPRAKPETQEANWLKQNDMLPSLIPEGRIMGYGFNLSALSAKVDFKAAASMFAKEFNRVSGRSHKPIVLIGHGYGNVIIQALLCSRDEESEAFKRLTTAVILFAPPISGSAELNKWCTNKMKLSRSASENVFVGLGKDSGELQNVWANFRSEVSGWDTSICMYLPKQNNIESSVDSKDVSDEAVRATAKHPHDDGYDVLQTSSGFDDIASFSSTKDRTFLRIASQIVNSIQVWLFLDATLRGDRILLSGLIKQYTINMNLAGKTGQNSLLLSAQRGDLSLMKILLGERQLDIDHQNNHGNTALHLAVTNSAYQEVKREMILSLLKAGANPDIANRNKKKPKQLASKSDLGIKYLFTKNRPLVEGPLIQPRKRLKKSSPPGDEAIKACKSVEMFVTEMYFIKDSETRVPEQHWTMYRTIYDLIYAQRPGTVESMLDGERSNNVKDSEKPYCRWYHIPENNMVWIEDMFAQLLIEVDPWPSHHRGGKIPHSRSMNPEAVVLQSLDPDPDQKREGVAIMMPYISYESSNRQQALKTETRKVTRERKENLGDRLKSTIPTLRDDEISSVDYDMVDWLDENDTNVAANNPPRMESIPRIIFTDTQVKRQENIIPPAGTAAEMGGKGLEDNNKSKGGLAVPQFSLREVRDHFQAVIDASDSESDEGILNTSNQRSDSTGVRDQLRAYLYHQPPLHPRRTLDQSYYYMLQDTAIRDLDQVVSRYAKNNPDIGKDDHNILMVDQLWIWYIKGKKGSQEPDTVITCFPNRQGAKVKNSRDLDDLWFQVLANKIHQSRGVISSAADLIARVIEVCSGTLNRHQHVEKLQFVQMFEATIGDAEDRETQMLRQFRRIVKQLQNLNDKHPKYHKFRSEKLTKLLDIQDESGLLKDIKDTRDEIKMIKAILTDQLKVLKSLTSPKILEGIFALTATSPQPHATIPLLDKVQSSLEEINEQFGLMENHAKEVELGITGLMDLKQRQANLWEARSSREGAEETARQGNTILVFTIVTIIFLPLSFMASFFALAISQFPKDNQGNTQWPLHYVSGLLFGISFAVSIPLLLFAFNVGYVERAWCYLRFVFLQKCAILAFKQLRHVPIVSVRKRGYEWLTAMRKTVRSYTREGQEEHWIDKYLEHREKKDDWLYRTWFWKLGKDEPIPPVDEIDEMDWDEWKDHFMALL